MEKKINETDTITCKDKTYKKEEIINRIIDYLKLIIENLGINVDFETIIDSDRITIKMKSDNDSILIGRNGQTIKALEILSRQKIYNETGIYFRFNLDVSDYKEKQKEHLEYLAKKSAKEVLRTKAPVILDNMTSYERRIVHNALTEINGIKTESEGEEPNRHIIIKPL